MSGDDVTGAEAANVTDGPSQPLTAAERAKRYRQRQKRQAHGSWPPFEPGNQAAVTHGAYRASIGQEAVRLAESLRDDPACPWLAEPAYWPLELAFSRATLMAEKLWAFMEGHGDVQALLSEVTSQEGTQLAAKGRVTSRTVSTRVASAFEAWVKVTGRQEGLADKLGLSPAARARMRLDVAPTFDSALVVAALLEQDRLGAERDAAAPGEVG